MSISVLGAGAFGTALAISLSRGGVPVTLWSRDAGQATDMQQSRENHKRLPSYKFPDSLEITSNINSARAAKTLLIAIPTQKLAGFARQHAADLDGRNLVACCKGIDLNMHLGPAHILQQACPAAKTAILTGPSFAADIARGLPTALTLACADEKTGANLQNRLSTDNLRLYRTTDVLGAELGGALKNVIAIACGVAIGAGLGESARAAVMTRGYAEMQRLAQAMGVQSQTLSGLSGFGDLTLTCTSSQSRNYSYGISLGQGEGFAENITVEGAKTAFAVADIAKNLKVDMPITLMITAIINADISIQAAMATLFSRPLTKE